MCQILSATFLNQWEHLTFWQHARDKENGCCRSLLLADPILSPSASIWSWSVVFWLSDLEWETDSPILDPFQRDGLPFYLEKRIKDKITKRGKARQIVGSSLNASSTFMTSTFRYPLLYSASYFMNITGVPIFAAFITISYSKKKHKIYWHFL